ncbi:MAG: hypothetical protein AAB791_00130 [Patescibacteria group bacterium]
MIEKIIGLKPAEEIRNIIRSSLWHWFWPIILASVFFLAPFFCLYPLFKAGWWGIIIFVALLAVSLILFLRIYLQLRFNAFILTSQRLVDLEQNGFFSHYISGFLYDRIQEVNCQSLGLMNAVFKTGDVYISLVGENKMKLKLPAVKHPAKAVSLILSIQEEFLSESQEKALNQAEYLLNKIRKKVGGKVFERLISD